MAVQVNNYFGSYYPSYQCSPFMSTWIMPLIGMGGGCQQIQGLRQAYMYGSYIGMMFNMQRAMAVQQMMCMSQMQTMPQVQLEQNDGAGGVSKTDKTDKTDKSEKDSDKTSKNDEPKEQKVTKELKDQILNGTYSGDYIKINGVTHYRYKDCKEADRVSIGNGQQLHKDAAAAFNKMKEAAAKEGISLHVHSGLRTSATQKDLFSSKMKTKNRSFEDNLKWSAPANFSEHHTGLALDINCADNSFGNSKEYKWLKEHASEYGFELSFPENNAQGLGFEPWHWRYVGKNGEYKSVFAAARENDSRFN